MRIPDTIKIGAITWTVEQVAPDDFDDQRCGETDHIKCRIRINRDLLDDVKALTLLHELFHAINGEMNHSDVEMMSSVLHQVLTENDLNFK